MKKAISGLLVSCLLLTSAIGAEVILQCAAIEYPTKVDESTPPDVALEDLLVDLKIADTVCKTTLCKAVEDWRKAVTEAAKEPDAAKRSASMNALTNAGLELLRTTYESFAKLPEIDAVTEKLRTQFELWNRMTLGASEREIDRLPKSAWQRNGHILFWGDPANQIDFNDAFANQCQSNSVGSCAEYFRTATCGFAHSLLERQILDGFLTENKESFKSYLEGLTGKWKSYRTNGRSLYPWEILLNEKFVWKYSTASGFSEPPTKQYVFLHPDVAVQFNSISNTDHLKDAIVIELIGRDRWSYSSSSANPFKAWTGMSIIAAWTGDSAPSYGVMTHWKPNLAAGLTIGKFEGDTRLFLFVTADVGKLLTSEGSVRDSLVKAVLKK